MLSLLSRLFGKSKTAFSLDDALQSLPEDYYVFKSILYNRNEIKAVVYERSQGIVLINTCEDKGTVKFYGNTVYVKRKPRSELITKTLQDTFWLKSTIRNQITLDVSVIPMIAFSLATVQVSSPFLGVRLIATEELVQAITSLPKTYNYPDGILVALRELHGSHNVFEVRQRGL